MKAVNDHTTSKKKARSTALRCAAPAPAAPACTCTAPALHRLTLRHKGAFFLLAALHGLSYK
jgi:hypothetical protein